MDMKRAGASAGKATHRVAKRMIERLEKKESIQVDHSKFAKLALDPTLSMRIPWTLPGGPKVEIEEKYSMNFWRAMNTPGDRIKILITLKNFDSGLIYESKSLAKAGRDAARKLAKDGLHVRHQAEIGVIPEHTTNTFLFEITAHFTSYRTILQPIIRNILKAFPLGEVHVTVTHVQLESYANAVMQQHLKNDHSALT